MLASCVTRITWHLRESFCSCNPESTAAFPPSPASISSNTIVGGSHSSGNASCNASNNLLSSPPDAIFSTRPERLPSLRVNSAPSAPSRRNFCKPSSVIEKVIPSIASSPNTAFTLCARIPAASCRECRISIARALAFLRSSSERALRASRSV